MNMLKHYKKLNKENIIQDKEVLLYKLYTISLSELMSYVKSTHSEDIFPWQCYHSNIYNTSLSSITAILLAIYSHISDATI